MKIHSVMTSVTVFLASVHTNIYFSLRISEAAATLIWMGWGGRWCQPHGLTAPCDVGVHLLIMTVLVWALLLTLLVNL